jgi:hypothetical protein
VLQCSVLPTERLKSPLDCFEMPLECLKSPLDCFEMPLERLKSPLITNNANEAHLMNNAGYHST